MFREKAIQFNKAHAAAEKHLQSLNFHIGGFSTKANKFAIFTNGNAAHTKFVGYINENCDLDSIEIKN